MLQEAHGILKSPRPFMWIYVDFRGSVQGFGLIGGLGAKVFAEIL